MRSALACLAALPAGRLLACLLLAGLQLAGLLLAGLLLAAPPAGATLFREVAASPEPDGAPSFSPDGQQVAFSSPLSGDWEIYTVGAWGGPLTNFTDSPGVDIYANWSPAGPWIVFTSRRDNGHGTDDMDLWLKNTADGSELNLTTWPGYDNFGALDPAGERVAFSSDRGAGRPDGDLGAAPGRPQPGPAPLHGTGGVLPRLLEPRRPVGGLRRPRSRATS